MAWKRLSIRQCRESVHLANDLYETEKRLRELKKSRGVAAISAEVLFTLYPSTDANDCDLVRVTVGASDAGPVLDAIVRAHESKAVYLRTRLAELGVETEPSLLPSEGGSSAGQSTGRSSGS